MSSINKNLINARIDSAGNVVVGDGNIVLNLKEASEYATLIDSIKILEVRIRKTKNRISKYPTDESFKKDLSDLKNDLAKKKTQLSSLKKEVIRLAVSFISIPLDTNRLSQAKLLFQEGKFREARAILDIQTLSEEIDIATERSEIGEELSKTSNMDLYNLSNELLILAQLTAIDYGSSNRVNLTKTYFEKSIKTYKHSENLFIYASFLHQHNFTDKALIYYTEALVKFKESVESNAKSFDDHQDVAGTLSMLGSIYSSKHKYERAEELLLESLSIIESLYKQEPKKVLYIFSSILNEIGLNYSKSGKLEESHGYYQRAMKLLKDDRSDKSINFVDASSQVLFNFGTLMLKLKKLDEAKKLINAAIVGREELIENFPDDFDEEILARYYNNYALILKSQKDVHESKKFFNKAREIYSIVFEKNPEKYAPEFGICLRNIGQLLYKEGSLKESIELLIHAGEIQHNLCDLDVDVHASELIKTLKSTLTILQQLNWYEKVFELLQILFEIVVKLSEKKPSIYLQELADSQFLAAGVYLDVKDLDMALAYANRAIENYKEVEILNNKSLVEKIINTNSLIADIYFNSGEMTNSINLIESNLEAYSKLDSKISEKLSKEINEAKLQLSSILNQNGDFDKASEILSLTIKYFKKKYENESSNSSALKYIRALSLLGDIKKNTKDYVESEESYNQAELLLDQLLDKNFDKDFYNQILVGIYNNKAILYKETFRDEDAKINYLKCLELVVGLAEKNPDKYLLHIAMTLVNFSMFLLDRKIERKRSLVMIKDALNILIDYEHTHEGKRNIGNAMYVLKEWGVSEKEYYEGTYWK